MQVWLGWESDYDYAKYKGLLSDELGIFMVLRSRVEGRRGENIVPKEIEIECWY